MVANTRIREAPNDGGREGQTEEKDGNNFGKHRLPGAASSGEGVKEIVNNNR